MFVDFELCEHLESWSTLSHSLSCPCTSPSFFPFFFDLSNFTVRECLSIEYRRTPTYLQQKERSAFISQCPELNYHISGYFRSGRRRTFGEILYCLCNSCLWSVYKRVEHIFHFRFGILPFFHWSRQEMEAIDGEIRGPL